MTNEKKIVIIRHGETKWNVEGKLQGQGNSDLTKLGENQAECVAKAIKNEKFDLCFSSDLPRCAKTAQIINQYHQLQIIYDKKLRERNFGLLQGMTKIEIKEKYQDIYKKLSKGNINFVVPKGESFRDFYNRVSDFFDTLEKNYSQERVLIISHGGVLDCLMRRIMNLSLEAHRCFTIYNTSINRFFINEGVWKLETWGDINHLKSISTTDDF